MRITLAILFVAMIGPLAGCGKQPAPVSTSDRGSGEFASDHQRLQGVWTIESFETGEPLNPREVDEAKGVRFQFQGDRLTMVLDQGRHGEDGTFLLDMTQSPKAMTVTEAGDPKKQEWLYKFEGDNLILAFVKSGEPRPTDFKPRAPVQNNKGFREGGVTIVRLKKSEKSPVEIPKRNATTNRPGTSK